MVDSSFESSKLSTEEIYPYSYSPEKVETSTFIPTLSGIRSKIAPTRFKLAAKDIIRELSINPKHHILELGSGLGLLGSAIKDQSGSQISYFGVDIVFDSTRKSNSKGITSLQSDLIDLPFKDSSFDALITTDVLEHIPHAEKAVSELKRVLKPGGKAFIVIADPSEGRFDYVPDHINRTGTDSNIKYWENLFSEKGLKIISNQSEKFRNKDWRRIFNLPFLVRLKNKPGFACAFNPVNRPGTYIIQKPLTF